MPYRPQFTTALALSQIGNDFVRPPSDTSLREATVRVFKTGPLHGYLEKGVSEPNWIGRIERILSENSHKVKTILLG
jgi:hypothetical protein